MYLIIINLKGNAVEDSKNKYSKEEIELLVKIQSKFQDLKDYIEIDAEKRRVIWEDRKKHGLELINIDLELKLAELDYKMKLSKIQKSKFEVISEKYIRLYKDAVVLNRLKVENLNLLYITKSEEVLKINTEIDNEIIKKEKSIESMQKMIEEEKDDKQKSLEEEIKALDLEIKKIYKLQENKSIESLSEFNEDVEAVKKIIDEIITNPDLILVSLAKCDSPIQMIILSMGLDQENIKQSFFNSNLVLKLLDLKLKNQEDPMKVLLNHIEKINSFDPMDGLEIPLVVNLVEKMFLTFFSEMNKEIYKERLKISEQDRCVQLGQKKRF